jgi:hypothetical protein
MRSVLNGTLARMPDRDAGVTELAREYQDYVIAHRVRTLMGGRLMPKNFLSLPQYASRRLERQRLAREIVTVKPLTPDRLRVVDDLTDELCFGMWRNPREINDFLHAVLRLGGHPIFEFEQTFADLILEEKERARLPQRGLEIARFYRTCLTLGAAMLNIDEMELAAQRVEDLAGEMPLFLDVFNAEPV